MHLEWIPVLILLSRIFVSGDRVVSTTTGKVRGTTIHAPDGKAVEAFLGIPFAEPPIGELRFEKPTPITPWKDVYNATTLPPPCYQNYTQKFYWTPDVDRMSEDCLYLNIWVPGSLQGTKLKAVFLWIYGGAFNLGSSEMDMYNGAVLASRGDIIVASMNYRLGIFGFLTTPAPEAAGNMGIFDQLLAAKWIKSNVEAFGGDPELITVAGESAGAMSAALLLVSPMAGGLFKRVVLESGGAVTPISKTATQNMMKVAHQISDITGCSNSDVNVTSNPKIVVDCLKQLPPNAISEAEGSIMKTYPITATPHVDGVLIPSDPADMLSEGHFDEVDVLLGINKEEGALLLIFTLPEYFGFYGAGAPILKKRLAGYMIKNVFLLLNEKNTEVIGKFYVEGGGNRKVQNETNHNVDYMKTALFDSIGDYLLSCPAVFQADIMSIRSKPVYFYLFTHRPSTTLNADWMGVTHLDEVPFVFGRPLTGDRDYTEDDKVVSERMMDRWIAFVKTGNPNIPGEVSWPPYKWNDPVYLEINVQEKVGKKPDDYRCEFWRDRFRANTDHFKNRAPRTDKKLDETATATEITDEISTIKEATTQRVKTTCLYDHW